MTEKTGQPSLITRIIHGGKWQNFAAGIACGAAYISLHSLHWHPHWITILEMILFFLNVIVFTTNFALLVTSAIIKPDRFFGNLKNPSLNLLVPLVALDYATLTIGIVYYGCELGNFDCSAYSSSYLALFWTYFGVSLFCCVPIILVWFGSVGKAHELSSFSLTGCFLVFPMMLNGTVGIAVLSRITADHPGTLQVLLTSYIMQGLGFSVSMAFIVVSQYRTIRYGFHRGASAASAFIAAGPPGFTALALLRLGQYARDILPRHTPIPQQGADIFYYAAMPAALFLQGLAVHYWMFALLPWLLTWKAHLIINPAGSWPMTFPTAGLTSTFLALGDAFGSTAFYVLQAIWAGIIVFEFIVIFSCWLFRLLKPTDPDLKEARMKAWNDEQLSFWGSYREAELAEQKYLTELKVRNTSRDRLNGTTDRHTA